MALFYCTIFDTWFRKMLESWNLVPESQ